MLLRENNYRRVTNEIKKLVKDLNWRYEKIHVCKNDCIYVLMIMKYNKFKVCDMSRYK